MVFDFLSNDHHKVASWWRGSSSQNNYLLQ